MEKGKYGSISALEIQQGDVEYFPENKSFRKNSLIILLFGVVVTVCTVGFSDYNGKSWNMRHAINFAEEPYSDTDSFTQFVQTYQKTYKTTAERDYRLNVFLKNAKIANDRNILEKSKGGTAVHGVTIYSDLTEEEFYSLQGHSIKLTKDNHPSLTLTPPQPIKSFYGLSGYKNWAGVYTTPIKSQGQFCKAGWAFAIIEQIESDSLRVGYTAIDSIKTLSIQELISCINPSQFGCFGGDMSKGLDWIAMNGGVVYDSDYPYVQASSSTLPSCGFNKSVNSAVINLNKFDVNTFPVDGPNPNFMSISSYGMTFGSEEDMAKYVLNTGPITTYINSAFLQFYQSGVLSSCPQDDFQLNHAVQIVGISMDSADNSNSYWIVRNSYGSDWGINGYFYLKYGSNMCGIGVYSFYTSPKVVYNPGSYNGITGNKPTKKPTSKPSIKPTVKPSVKPTAKPSKTLSPTSRPTLKPSSRPTNKPTSKSK